MRAFITLESVTVLPQKPVIFTVGGFTAVSSDGREFMFDFEELYANVEKDESTGKYIFKCQLVGRDIDVFIEVNEENGVKDIEITPKFIATSKFTEIFYECYLTYDDELQGQNCKLIVTSFTIEEGEESVDVPSEELERYNTENSF